MMKSQDSESEGEQEGRKNDRTNPLKNRWKNREARVAHDGGGGERRGGYALQQPSEPIRFQAR